MFNETLLGVELISPDRDVLDILIFIIQILTLVFLIIYVKKTWDIASATRASTKTSERMLEEMRDERDQETAPYVIAYFEFKNHVIYLYIKNIGKTAARNVTLEFEPKLQTKLMEDYISNTNLIKNGIKSLAPGQEIKTLFDTAPSYLNSSLPMCYTVKISYSGGLLNNLRESEQILDISVQSGLIPDDQRGIPELVEVMKKLSEHNKNMGRTLDKIRADLTSGIWLNNTSFMINEISPDSAKWTSLFIYKLNEFKNLWHATHCDDYNVIGWPRKNLDMRLNIICFDLIIIISNNPRDIHPELIGSIYSHILELCRLQWEPSHYWNTKEAIEKKSSEVEKIIDELLKQIESEIAPISD